MSFDLKVFLKNKAINGWPLFLLVSVPMSALIIVEMMSVDLSTGSGVSHMIGFSVRFAVPLIFLVIAASSVQILFPGPFPMWWLRNRKHIGLCFAVAMAWQGLFIFMMSMCFREYYYADIYLLRDELEGSVGYLFLPVMVLTSFNVARKHLSQQQWKLIHKTGIYFLWAYPFSVYWWNLYYYENPQPMDYLFYWSGFVAFALRIAAWGKRRVQTTARKTPESRTPGILKALGGAVIAFGLIVSATGLYWERPVTAFLTGAEWAATLELWLPFWPFQPFLSLLIIAFGTLLATRAKDQGI